LTAGWLGFGDEKGMPRGLKLLFLFREIPKAEALGYLDAKADPLRG